MTTLEAALLYESWGWCVVPLYPLKDGKCTCRSGEKCKNAGKHPYVKWAERQHTDREEIIKLWGKRPESGVGVLTGRRSGIGVLDLDGEAGLASLQQLVNEHGSLPKTLSSVSGSGVGKHYVYLYPEGELYANSASVIAQGVDIRGEGGLFVAPPTLHGSGNRYAWDEEPAPPTAVMGAWLAEKARKSNDGMDLPFEDRFPRSADGKVAEGSHYYYIFKLQARLQRYGFTKEETEAALVAAWTMRLGRDDMGECRRAIKKAMSNWDRYDTLQLDPGRPQKTAEEFTQRERPTLLHVNGDWFAYNCVGYEELEDGTVRSELYGFMARANQRVKVGDEWRTEPFEPNRDRVGNAQDALRALAHRRRDSYTPPCWLWEESSDPDPLEVVACENGLLDLSTGNLLEPTARFFTRNVLGLSYDPDAPAPGRWLKFLEEVFPGEPEKADMLQEWFGYCLVPDTSQQKILPIIGPTRSGKGTIARVLSRLVGQENVVGPSLNKLGGTFALQSLIGKTLMVVSDLRIGRNTDVAAVTETLLTVSGEDLVTTDRKNKTAWSGKLATRIVIVSNELPRIADTSAALANRFIPLEMGVSFLGREDPQLTEKLMEELPGILGWAVEGLRRLRERGRFDPPGASHEAIIEIGRLGSPVRSFVDEVCELDTNASTSATELYAAYRSWAEAEGLFVVSGPIFGRDLRAAAQIRKERQRGGDDRIYVYRGVRLARETPKSPF